MLKLTLDGIATGSAALAFVGLSSLVFTPKNINLALATGVLGGVGNAIALKQQKQQKQLLEQQIQSLQSQVTQFKQQLKPTQNPILKPLPEEISADTVDISTDLAVVNVEEAIAWLGTRGIIVDKYNQYDLEIDPIFDRIALYLGKNYLSLAVLYRELKKSANSGRSSILSLSNTSQNQVSSFTNFCSMLSQSSLLSHYNYFRSEKTIKATVQNRGDVKNFFTGTWFERYIYQSVSQILTNKNIKYTCLINPHIQFSKGDRFELDLLFLIEGKPLWIECKTGKEYNAHFQKYSQHRNTLNIPKERAFLVILDLPDNQIKDLTNLWNITVTNQDNFAQAINDLLQNINS